MSSKKDQEGEGTQITQIGEVLWKKLTGLWKKEEDLDIPLPPHLKIPPEVTHLTSRTISENHTLHGQLNKNDLLEKGHNFDTTEVEMGKLKLHEVPPTHLQPHAKEMTKNFSNVDGATYAGVKIDLNRGSFFNDLIKSHFNPVAAFRRMRERTEQLSHLSEDTLHVRLPKNYFWNEVFKISIFFLILAGAIVGTIYGVKLLSKRKDAPVNTALETNHQGPEVRDDFNESDVTASVNYQATGRGLVYNCRGRHWACVDKENYIKCRKLSKEWEKDCVTQGVFENNQLCFDTQQKFTNSNAPVDFCKN